MALRVIPAQTGIQPSVRVVLRGVYTLCIVDPSTGTLTPVGPTSGVFVESLSFDPSGRVFGISKIPESGIETLYEFDVSNGTVLSSVEIVAPLQNPAFNQSLAIHPFTGEFYTAAALSGLLFKLDPTSGIASFVGFTGLSNIRSLAFVFEIPEPSVGIQLFLGSSLMSGLLARRTQSASGRLLKTNRPLGVS